MCANVRVGAGRGEKRGGGAGEERRERESQGDSALSPEPDMGLYLATL